MEKLTIVHTKSGSPSFTQAGWVSWKTCLREISAGLNDVAEPIGQGQEIYSGIEAYQFLLEVVCGLKSPIVAETEVMGQFKQWADKTAESIPQMRRLFRSILTDAKHVRVAKLSNIGSRSYGSLLRRYLKDSEDVSIIGAGQLVGEILPWFKEVRSVKVLCRRVEQGLRLREDHPFIEVGGMNSPLSKTIILAAPLSNLEFQKILESSSVKPEVIIDMRNNSGESSADLATTQVTLKQIFGDIEATQGAVQEKVFQAQALIKDLASKWYHSTELRPFGWEDLCG